MNPKAAQEFMDLIMLDDFVARKKAGDEWSQKWITTLYVEFVHDGTCPEAHKPMLEQRAKAVLLREIYNALVKDELHTLFWGRLADNPNSLVCQMHVILQEPRELTSGQDAYQKMLAMAKGGAK